MTSLLVLREQIKKIYSSYEVYITPISRFLLALVSIIIINGSIGYMSELKNMVVVVLLSLMCSFLPVNFVVFVAAVVALGHLYALSVECAAVALAIFLLLFVLYFRFTPNDTLVVLFTPLCFILKIPYVMPIVCGLVATPVSVVSMLGGVVVYHVIGFMSKNASVINTFDEGALQKFRFVIDGIIDNKSMYIMMVSFAVTLLVVYFIRRLSVDYSWTVAMITGTLANVIILLLGDLLYGTNISVAGVILGSIVSILIAKVFEFFVFNVDYSRTEMVQFEDDEYYYYVKAVPKNTVSTPQKRVKTIRVPEKAVKQQKKN